MTRLVRTAPLLIALAVGLFVQPPSPAQAQPARCGNAVALQIGDTLASISRRCGVSLTALIGANRQLLNPNAVRAGTIIYIPGGGVGLPPRPHQPAPVHAERYTVRPGDTLASIARMAGVPLAAIYALNPEIDARFLRVGDVVRLPRSVGSRPPPRDPPPSGPVTRYVVRPGDTLFSISRRLGVPMASIIALNPNIDARYLRVGDVLRLPGGIVPYPPEPPEQDGRRRIRVTGTLTTGGAECQAMRGDDGRSYTLTGNLDGFRPGDRVEVVGRRAEVSFCMQGATIEVRRIRPAD